MPYGRKRRDWRGNMTKQGISRKNRVLILALACVMLGAALFGICASAAVTDYEVSDFSYQDLTATISYDTSGEAVEYSKTNENSIKVKTSAREKISGALSWKKYEYIQQSSTLKIVNRSSGRLQIEYTISVTTSEGDGRSVSTSGTYNSETGTYVAEIQKNGSFTITSTSGQRGAESSRVSDKFATSYTVKIVSVKAVTKDIEVTFKGVTPAGKVIPGSYAVTVDGKTTTVTSSDVEFTKDSSTKYSLEATPNGDYKFKGWYVNGELVSDQAKWDGLSMVLIDTNTVEAAFAGDILLEKITLSDTDSSGNAVDPSMTKYDYVEATSQYTPDGYRRVQNTNKDGTLENGVTANTELATMHTKGEKNGIKDYKLFVFDADPEWVDSGTTALKSSLSGTAESEYVTQFLAEGVNGYAIVNSPVLRIKARQNIKISFDYSVSMTIGKDSTSFIYYYIGDTANATRKEIVSGNQIVSGSASGSGTGYEISVQEGKYLYIYSRSYFHDTDNYYFITGVKKDYKYTYTATMSNFKVTPVNEHFSVRTGFQDNTGIALGSGRLRAKDASSTKEYTVGTDGFTTSSYENIAGTQITFSVVSSPSNYVHIGWKDVTAGKEIYGATYTVTLDSNREIYALFTPAMTITMKNGYSDAGYQYKPLNSSSMKSANGQYVARNADGSAFYTTLAQAFGATDTVVLLAGDTFNGDFTVPEGKTLVVPYGLDDGGSTTPEQITSSSTLSGLSSYVTVTMNGNVTVDGTLVVSGRQYGPGNGRPIGPIGRLVVAAGANITVNGTLDAFGAVAGDGHIEVNSGAKVYELMEVRDLRGIYQLFDISKSSNKVFFFNSYFVKSIEAEAKYNWGARLYAHYSVMAAGSLSHGDAPIVGTSGDSEGMFKITSGSLTKSYDSTDGRTVFRFEENSNVNTGYFKLTVKSPIAAIPDINISTDGYALPMSYGYKLEIAGNLTINSDFKMLPGAVVDVEKTGTLNVQNNLVFYRLNDYDTRSRGSDAWQGFSTNGYPLKPTTLPGSQNVAITAQKIGSAKLNVDGAVVVSGGLHVTDSSDGSEQRYNSYENGYNNLTGTGTIKVGKYSKSFTLYEAQEKSGDNGVNFVEVPLSVIKGLDYEAEVDEPGKYNAFGSAGTYYGYINSKGLSTWSTQKPTTLTYDANGGTGSIEPTRVPSGAKATVAANNGNIRFGDYKFTGWKDKNGNTYAEGQIIETLTEDLTLYAQWERTFTVTWVDWNGTELERDEKVAEGSTPSYDGETPTRAETEDIIYTFTGWSPELSPVTKDITYEAVYSRLYKNVKLVHADDTVDYYGSVSDAVNASTAGETVMLLKDRTESTITISDKTGVKNLTLDLNGKNITSIDGIAIVVEKNNTIRIVNNVVGNGVGNGTISAKNYGSAISNSGTIESISGGTFIGIGDAGAGLLIAQGSKVGTISGGTFQGQYGINVAGTLDTISNAALTGTSNGLYVNGGTVNTISGGTFTGGSIGLSVSNTGTVKTISGGTFVSTGAGGFAVKSSSGTAIEFVASGSPNSSNYNGPLFRSESGSRSGTVSDYGNTTMFKYPDGQTVSYKANEEGYFYIGKKEIYTVRVQWDGGLSYIYQPNQYTWIPEQMRYEKTETAGWISEEKGTTPMVTVFNGGNAANETYGNITVGISYNCNEGYNDIGMDFFVDDVKKGSSNSAKLVESMEPGKSVKTTMKLIGEPPTSIQKGTIIGRVTLTLTTAD